MGLLLIIGLAAALAYLPFATRAPSPLRSTLKTLPLAILAIAATVQGAPAVLILALLASAAGDLALSRDGERAFIVGLSAFALAHILYVALFLGWPVVDATSEHIAAPLLALQVAAFLALAISSIGWLLPHTGALRTPVATYIGLITAMVLSAILPMPRSTLIFWGAVSFVASDLILAIQRFRLGEGSFWQRPASWSLWILYISGQSLIASAYV